MIQKKIYFSEFDDEPSWNITSESKIVIIDIIDTYRSTVRINSPKCENPNIIFNWSTNSVMTIDEFNKFKSENK